MDDYLERELNLLIETADNVIETTKSINEYLRGEIARLEAEQESGQ